MSNNFLFQSDNYFTEAGLELFEDEWFEFYHEQHGKIMHKLLQNLK
jgi:ATP-dependent helicase/DNAse subunit B